MSSATSIRGESFEKFFREGFLDQNSSKMLNQCFLAEGVTVKNNEPKKRIGDIDAYFISSEECLLKDLLPIEANIFHGDFIVNSGDHIFFELTTTEGEILQRLDNLYVEKKMNFHSTLKFGTNVNLSNDSIFESFRNNKNNHKLIFIFNGADHARVGPKFDALCDQLQITGTSVYLGSHIIHAWPSEVKLARSEAAKNEMEALQKTFIKNNHLSYETSLSLVPNMSEEEYNAIFDNTV